MGSLPPIGFEYEMNPVGPDNRGYMRLKCPRTLFTLTALGLKVLLWVLGAYWVNLEAMPVSSKTQQ